MTQEFLYNVTLYSYTTLSNTYIESVWPLHYLPAETFAFKGQYRSHKNVENKNGDYQRVGIIGITNMWLQYLLSLQVAGALPAELSTIYGA